MKLKENWKDKPFDKLKWSDCPQSMTRSKWVCVLALRSMDYPDYLQTEHWHRLREEALKRDGYRCALGENHKGAMHVHHKTYERKGHESIHDLITLCFKCHERFHDATKIQMRESIQ